VGERRRVVVGHWGEAAPEVHSEAGDDEEEARDPSGDDRAAVDPQRRVAGVLRQTVELPSVVANGFPGSRWVTAFQASVQRPRWPSISKYCAGPIAHRLHILTLIYA
jgi:hypothetical protein